MVVLGLILIIVGAISLMKKTYKHLRYIKNMQGELVEFEIRPLSFPTVTHELFEENLTKIVVLFSPFHYPKDDENESNRKVKREMKVFGFVGLGLYILGTTCLVLKVAFPDLSRY